MSIGIQTCPVQCSASPGDITKRTAIALLLNPRLMLPTVTDRPRCVTRGFVYGFVADRAKRLTAFDRRADGLLVGGSGCRLSVKAAERRRDQYQPDRRSSNQRPLPRLSQQPPRPWCAGEMRHPRASTTWAGKQEASGGERRHSMVLRSLHLAFSFSVDFSQQI